MKYKEITEQILGAAMEVHKILGNGSREVIYQRALAVELELRDMAFEREKEMPIYYNESYKYISIEIYL